MKVKKSRRYWHKRLVMYEINHKNLHRDIDADWSLNVNFVRKLKHLPKYHGTKYRGLKRWLAKGKSTAKLTKENKNGKQ